MLENEVEVGRNLGAQVLDSLRSPVEGKVTTKVSKRARSKRDVECFRLLQIYLKV